MEELAGFEWQFEVDWHNDVKIIYAPRVRLNPRDVIGMDNCFGHGIARVFDGTTSVHGHVTPTPLAEQNGTKPDAFNVDCSTQWRRTGDNCADLWWGCPRFSGRDDVSSI